MSEEEGLAAPAQVIPLYTREQITQQVQAVLDITKAEAFSGDSARQAAAMMRVQVLWGQLAGPVRDTVRSRISEALHISPGRFDYLVRMGNPTELRLALRYTRAPFERNEDEQVYPKESDGWLGAYLRYAEVGEGHVGWHFWSGLTALAAACRRNFYLLGGHKRLYPNLYVILEGPSGSGKNTAIERAQGLLYAMNDSIVAQARPRDARVPLLTMLPNKMTPPVFVDSLQRGNRVTAEAPEIPTLGADYEHAGICVAPEASTLLSRDQFGVDQLIVLFTQAYDGWIEDATLARSTIQLHNVVLSLLLGSTMSWLRKNITATVFEGGFMGARCLVIPKPLTGRCYPREPLVDPVQRDALAEALAWYSRHDPTEMILAPDAERAYDDWYRSRELVSEDDRIASYFGRKRVYLLKLAILFAVSRHHIPEIPLSDMEDAIKLLAHEEPTMLHCFRQVLEPEHSNNVGWLHQTILGLGGQVTRRDLCRRTRHKFSVLELDELLTSLKAQELLGVRTLRNERGPPTLVYYLTEMFDAEGKRTLGKVGLD